MLNFQTLPAKRVAGEDGPHTSAMEMNEWFLFHTCHLQPIYKKRSFTKYSKFFTNFKIISTNESIFSNIFLVSKFCNVYTNFKYLPLLRICDSSSVTIHETIVGSHASCARNFWAASTHICLFMSVNCLGTHLEHTFV